MLVAAEKAALWTALLSHSSHGGGLHAPIAYGARAAISSSQAREF
jgi:hypothetical protein